MEIKNELEIYSGKTSDANKFCFEIHYANLHPDVKDSLLSMPNLLGSESTETCSTLSEIKCSETEKMAVKENIFLHDSLKSAIETAVFNTSLV